MPKPMPQPLPQLADTRLSNDDALGGRRRPWAAMAAAFAVALLLGTTVVLWAHYGTTVFYEMILAGIAACF